MLRFGVLGAGHLGKIHLGLLQQMEEVEIVGFFDPHDPTAQQVAEKYRLKRYNNINELINAAQAIDIVTPHFATFFNGLPGHCARKAYFC